MQHRTSLSGRSAVTATCLLNSILVTSYVSPPIYLSIYLSFVKTTYSQSFYHNRLRLLYYDKVKGLTLAERLISARQLLQKASRNPLNASLSVRNQISVFMSSKEALQLAVEQKSQFRLWGDGVAHHDLNKPQFISIVDEHCKRGGKYGNGLKALIQFLFP